MNERDNDIFAQQVADFEPSNEQYEYIVIGELHLQNGVKNVHGYKHTDLVREVYRQAEKGVGKILFETITDDDPALDV